MDIADLSPLTRDAMNLLANELSRIESNMGKVPNAEKAAILSRMAAEHSFAAMDEHNLAQSIDRLIQAAAVSLLMASLAL